MLTYSDTFLLPGNMSISIFKFHLEQLWRSMSMFSTINLKPRELAKKTITHLWILIFSIERDHCKRSTRELDLDSRTFVQVLSAISQLEMRISPKKAVRVSAKIQRKDIDFPHQMHSLPSNETTSNAILIYCYCTFSRSNTCKMLVSWKWFEASLKSKMTKYMLF